jgi:ribosome-associated translation inhibitor RaiA
LYYSKYLGDTEESLSMDFGILDVAKQFNNISLDRSGTQISDLPDFTSSLSSVKTGNKAYIQSGTGIACRIDFPNIKQLKYISEKGAIVDAELIIKPIKNTYSDKNYSLPDSLRVFVVDKLNRVTGTLNNTGSATYAVLNTQTDEFNENIGYKVSIGAFLQNEMIKNSDSKLSLILTVPNILKSVNRVMLGDQKNSNNKIQLKIYYISY